MRTLIFTFISLALISFSYGQSVYPGIDFTSFGSIDVQEEVIVVSGSCDQLYISQDNGNTWTSNTSDYMSALKLLPNNTQFIGSSFGKLRLFDLTGNVIQDFSTNALVQELGRFMNVVVTDQYVYAFGADQILKSEIDSYDWKSIYKDTLNDYAYTLDMTSNHIYIGSRQGKIMSLNLSNDEVILLQDLEQWILDLSMGTNEIGYVHAQGGKVLKTTDGFNTLMDVDGFPEHINPIAYGENIVMTVNTNRVYVSTDGGLTSQRVSTANSDIEALTFGSHVTKDGEIYFVGENAMVRRTKDFCQSFEELNPLYRGSFHSASFNTIGEGLAVGDYGRIIKSSNWGDTWQETNNSLSSAIYYITALNDNEWYYSTSGTTGLLDKNGAMLRNENYDLGNIDYKISTSTLYATQNSSNNTTQVVQSTDKGLTWSVALDEPNLSTIVNVGSDGRIFVPSMDSILWISDDDGDNWSSITLGVNRMFSVESDGEVILVNDGRRLYKTIDNGETIDYIANVYQLRNIQIIEKDRYIYTSGQNRGTTLYETLDGGETSKVLFSSCSSANDVQVLPNNQLLISHYAGHINKTNLTSPNRSKEVIYNSMIYPNPVQVGMDIIIEHDVENVEIFDAFGNQFQPTIEGNMIKAPNQTGIYFVRQKIGGAFMVNKLIVIN